MTPADLQRTGFSAGRRWLTTVNLVVATLAALALGVMFNYLAAGCFRRFPLAEATNFKLSAQTLDVLHSLTNDVRITIFYQRKADVYSMVSALLAEYQNANPAHIHLGAVDYDRSPGDAGKLLARLHLGRNQKDFVSFECNGQHKICYDSKLTSFDFHDLLRGREVRRKDFFGELYFTSDIFAVSHPSDLKAYFLTGHGERNPGDPTGQRTEPDGTNYTKLAAILKDEISCDWQCLALSQTDSIPADCNLLIIASGDQTRQRMSSNDLFQIQNYLQHKGRLLALLNVTEGLDPVLANWGAVLRPMHIIDQDPAVQISKGEFLVGAAVDSSSASVVHPIMKPLVREGLNIQMYAPHPIFPSKEYAPGEATFSVVAATTNGIQAPGDRPLITMTNGNPLPPRTYCLVAAIEQDVINGHDGTRMVLAGDADFLDDKMIDSSANHYFASQALDWLLQRPLGLAAGIGPRPIKEYKLSMTERQTTQVRWLFLGGMPGSVLFLGGLVWLRRRS